MGLNEFPPLLGEGLMIKALPGLAAAVGGFVRAYGCWLTAAPARFPLAALPLELAEGLSREFSAQGDCGCLGDCCGARQNGGELWGGIHLAPGNCCYCCWRRTAHIKSATVCSSKG